MVDRDRAPARRAARLCAATVAWNLAVGGAAVATAAITGSLALIGFGVNAVVDSSVSALLVRRFGLQASGRPERVARLEHRALRMASAAFTIIAVYLLVQGIRSLTEGHRSATSVFGVVEAVLALAVLPYLAVAKYRLSGRLGSRALRADSLLTASGIALAAIALTGLLVQRTTGWRGADPVAALVIAAVLAWQGLRSFRES
jgi:divalent metal cation (Fe/Co/Zn/Cd) transporter